MTCIPGVFPGHMLCLSTASRVLLNSMNISKPRAVTFVFPLLLLILLVPVSRADDSVDRIVRGMTLKQKVGQMIMTSIIGREMSPKLASFLKEIEPGGITLFTYNIRKPEQLRELNRSIYLEMQRTGSGITPFIAIDQEGGLVSRLHKQVAVLPGNMTLGATRSTDLALRAGRLLGQSLRDYGFNMNLAPVLDINSNPQNPVIGIRSYSSDAKLVSSMGGAFIKGLQSNGVIAVGKHFPGHGDTFGDSHSQLPVISKGLRTLEKREFVPFENAFRNDGLEVLMTAHIALPELHHGRRIPATLSKLMLTDILRHRLGYKGVIMTDGMEMKGLLKTAGTLGRAAVLAVSAGADVLTINADPDAARQIQHSLLRAIRDGRISQQRIDESVRRILAVKQHHGLLGHDEPPMRVPDSKQLQAYREIAYDIAARGVTVVRNRHHTLPLDGRKLHRLWVVGDAGEVSRMRKVLPRVRIEAAQLNHMKDVRRVARKLGASGSGIVVLANDRRTILLAEQLAKQAKGRVVLINTGSPYLVRHPLTVDAILCTYSRMNVAVQAAMEVVAGKIPAIGRLPVRLSHSYPFGFPASTFGVITGKRID
jgi:beta-N-acetylhexosaminidase